MTPSLIKLSLSGKYALSSYRVDVGIQEIKAQGLVTEATVRTLLHSFFTGDPAHVLEPMHGIMTVFLVDGVVRFRLIPFYLMSALQSLENGFQQLSSFACGMRRIQEEFANS